MSNLGKWNKWYESVTDQMPFGDSESYVIGAKFLEDCEVVEDWGCGLGWFSKFRPNGYFGVDGSDSPFASKIVDLEEYTSFVDGIFMRHVLEHNYRAMENYTCQCSQIFPQKDGRGSFYTMVTW
jgi:hypothetical protein